MNKMNVGKKLIGENEPCFIIAEGCDNHLGNMETAKEMVRQAAQCGADAIKFQHHIVDEEMLREGVPMSDNFNMPLYEFLERYALTLDQHRELLDFCNQTGIIYMCTPFSYKAAEELDNMGLGVFKIGSGELTDIPSLKRIADLGKPMILSTGMATWEEIDETVAALKPKNIPLALMNCVSEYPAKYEDINLGVIKKMQARYSITIGHSDHTPDIYTTLASVAYGAKIVEKHFILDKSQPGPDQAVSIDPHDLKEMVGAIRKIEASMGGEKLVHELERPIRSWAHRSVVSITEITAGTEITLDHVWTKRPGTGIPSKELDKVIGKTAKKDIPMNTLISWGDLI